MTTPTMTIEDAMERTPAQQFTARLRKALAEGETWQVRGLAAEGAEIIERMERECLALGKLADDTAAEVERLRGTLGRIGDDLSGHVERANAAEARAKRLEDALRYLRTQARNGTLHPQVVIQNADKVLSDA